MTVYDILDAQVRVKVSLVMVHSSGVHGYASISTSLSSDGRIIFSVPKIDLMIKLAVVYASIQKGNYPAYCRVSCRHVSAESVSVARATSQ